jgi:exonuclease V gamma subunit
LNESLFPGRNVLPSLDLRSHDRRPGDVLPAEQNLFLLLEVLLSARCKLYLFYNNRELQKDRELLPAVPLVQLQRYLDERILATPFRKVEVGLQPHECLAAAEDIGEGATDQAPQDVLTQWESFPRALAVKEGLRRGIVDLTPEQKREWQKWQRGRPASFAAAAETSAPAGPITVHLKELASFLSNPAKALLQRQLHVEISPSCQASSSATTSCGVSWRKRSAAMPRAGFRMIRRPGPTGSSRSTTTWACAPGRRPAPSGRPIGRASARSFSSASTAKKA